VVGASRFEAGQEALRRFRLNVLLLDDGFQHRQLHRDLDLILLDATDPFGGGRLLPRGRLRESVSGLGRGDAIILSRADQASDLPGLRRCLEQIVPGVPQVLARHRPARLMRFSGGEEYPLAALSGRRVLAVSGIANPAGFHRTLADLGAAVVGRLIFPDHHPYEPEDLSRMNHAAHETEAEWIVITEKDHVRMTGVGAAPGEAGRALRPVVVLGVDLEIMEGAAALDALLLRHVGGGRG
jgi:tetraacyldisaccharide 4'-kinase